MALKFFMKVRFFYIELFFVSRNLLAQSHQRSAHSRASLSGFNGQLHTLIQIANRL